LLVFGLPETGYPLTKSGSIEPLGPGLKILFADWWRWLAIAALVVTVHAVSFAQWAGSNPNGADPAEQPDGGTLRPHDRSARPRCSPAGP